VNRIQIGKYYLAGYISLLTALVYFGALKNDFVDLDDNVYVLENLHIRSFDAAFFRWAFFDFYIANWHPLTWMSHALDYAAWGVNPFGHHLTNNLLHAVNTFIVVLLVVELLDAGRVGTKQSKASLFLTDRSVLIAAGTTGLLFGIHPVHVESVAWVAERKDLLCALFFMLSISDTALDGQGCRGHRRRVSMSFPVLFDDRANRRMEKQHGSFRLHHRKGTRSSFSHL
jgi:hypothetical protein